MFPTSASHCKSLSVFFSCYLQTEGFQIQELLWHRLLITLSITMTVSYLAFLKFACYQFAAAAAAKSLQSRPTLWDPIDGSPPGSPVPGILQARTLEWVATSFSNAWKWKVKVKSLSRVRLLATPWTAAYQAPPSMGFARQEYWSGLPLLSLTNLLSALKKNFF